jgi:hypothetical protein
MSVATTIDLIQAVNRTVTGARTVPTFDRYPLTADSVRLPLVLTWPEGAQWSRQHFGGKKREDRVYVIMVFVKAVGQGELPARSTEAVTLLDAFRDVWTALDAVGYPTALQNPAAGNDDVQVTLEWPGDYPQDTGVGVLPALAVGGTSYTGFEIRIKVRELW